MRIFISYNRDELLNCDEKRLKEIVDLINDMIEGDKTNTYYFDDLKNEGFTIAQIFLNIQSFLDNEDCKFLFVGNSLICYGWAERELRYALKKNREIRKIKTEKFLRYLDNKKFSLYRIYKKAKRLTKEPRQK